MPTVRYCTHEGIGIPGCPICDPRVAGSLDDEHVDTVPVFGGVHEFDVEVGDDEPLEDGLVEFVPMDEAIVWRNAYRDAREAVRIIRGADTAIRVNYVVREAVKELMGLLDLPPDTRWVSLPRLLQARRENLARELGLTRDARWHGIHNAVVELRKQLEEKD